MITEQQQEQASLYVTGALPSEEQCAFETELRRNPELQEFVRGLEKTADALAMATPRPLPAGLKEKVLARIDQAAPAEPPVPVVAGLAGLRFTAHDDAKGWKQLPIPGAWIKLLSLERDRGYAVLLGRLDPGVRYPAHTNAGPEDFYILTGDLMVGERKLGPGDFHHAEAGSKHEENYSVQGCTLLAVLTTDDPLVAFALA